MLGSQSDAGFLTPASKYCRNTEVAVVKENRQRIRSFLADDKIQITFRYAIWNVTVKLREIEEILKSESDRMVISYITSRIKTPDSVMEKLTRKEKKVTWESALQNLNDIVGIRAVCLFEEDIYRIRDYFYKQDDIHVIKEKDFIKKPKTSGYRSLHLILEVPVTCMERETYVRVELQLRTMAMDFWSVLEYQLQYKKKNEKVRAAQEQLKECAEDIKDIEEKMYDLKLLIDRM